MSSLKRDGGDGWYTITGTLDDISGPGNRVVTNLTVGRLRPDTERDLSVLRRFADLRVLTLRQADELDLAGLQGATVQALIIDRCQQIDIRPIAAMDQLETLRIFDPIDCIPPTTLPKRLHELLIEIEDRQVPVDFVRSLVDGANWADADSLRELELSIAPEHPQAPLSLNLEILRSLPHLTDLRVARGITPTA